MGDFLNCIKKIRKEKGVTQEEIAMFLGVKKQFICNLERSRKPLPLKRAIEIADFLNVSLDELVGRENQA